MTIVQAGDPVLRQVARPLSAGEIGSASIRRLIEEMKETMRAAPGVGLAAPQVGQALQLAVIEDHPDYTKDWSERQLSERERQPVAFHVLINPRLQLLEQDEPRVNFFEGCLSLAGMMALVERARRVRVECLDEIGHPRIIEARGWYARILQHEIDHLNGTLYIDRMQTRTLTTLENFSTHWRDKTIPAVETALGQAGAG